MKDMELQCFIWNAANTIKTHYSNVQRTFTSTGFYIWGCFVHCGVFVGLFPASWRNVGDFLKGEHKQNTFQRQKKK